MKEYAHKIEHLNEQYPWHGIQGAYTIEAQQKYFFGDGIEKGASYDR